MEGKEKVVIYRYVKEWIVPVVIDHDCHSFQKAGGSKQFIQDMMIFVWLQW